VRRRYARFYRIQREAMDHRKEADAQSLARSQSTEEVIARQYGVINAHNAQIAARAEEALRISNETLAQINTMNESLARIANRLDSMAGPPA
jgi:type IV secretory pathway component VirB8